MKEPSENDPAGLAQQRLNGLCQAMDRSARSRWVLLSLEIVLVLFLGLALADYWLLLPLSLRAVGTTVIALLIIVAVVRLVRFYLRPTRLKQGALTLEARRPDLGCEVSTAAEYLSGERKIEHEYEPELAAALEAKTAKALGPYSIPLEAKVIGYAALLGLTFLALGFLVLAAPGGLTALERTAVPFSKAHYTSVEVRPGDFEIPVGSSASITNIFSGRLPKDARIAWAEASNARWQTAALNVATQGVYLHTLTNLQSDLVYHVAGSDALSPDYKITTYIPPTVQEFNIRLTYPEYTRLRPSVQKVPDINAVRATRAEIRIRPSVGLKEARLRFSNQPGVPLVTNADGSWSATVPISKDSDYWIELADTKGHPGVNEKPYHLKALPDNPPKVEITEPGKDIRSSATNTVLVKISVADDFGVSAVKLVYNKLGGEQKTLEVQPEAGPNGEIIARAELDLSTLELKDYELVAYHAEASDNNTLDGPGTGKSPVYFVEITDEEGTPALAQGQGQQVNLLVIQKQIVADTTALPSDAPADKFKDMGVRQRDAAEFGRMYLEAISGGDTNAEAAVTEMHAAITDMEMAVGSLDKQQRSEAIPREESALAHLYQVVKLMPELQNLPTQPAAEQKPPPSPKVQVVLKAIKQKKKENPDNKEIEEALNQAKDLARAQSGLNNAMRNPDSSQGSGQQPGSPGDSKADSQAAQAKSEAQAAQTAQGQGQGQGQGQAQGQGQGRGQGTGQGENQGKEPGQNDPKAEQAQAESQDKPPESPGQIAEKEEQLSKEAEALAERLQRLAGNDQRLGHNLGKGAGRAAGKMAAAAKALAAGQVGAAGEHGFQGELALRNVVDQLERLLKNQPEPTDIAHEDAPKEYDTLISEYLKRLSHAD